MFRSAKIHATDVRFYAILPVEYLYVLQILLFMRSLIKNDIYEHKAFFIVGTLK